MNYYHFNNQPLEILIKAFAETQKKPLFITERIMMFLTIIYKHQIRNTFRSLDTEKVSDTHTRFIYSKLEKYFNRRINTTILNFFEVSGILDINRTEKTKYGHTKYYFKINDISIFTTYDIIPIINKDNITLHNDITIIDDRNFGSDYLKIINNIIKHNIYITPEQFNKEMVIKHKTYSKIKLEQGKTPLSVDEYIKIGTYVYDDISNWNKLTLKERKLEINLDNYGKRIHHILSYTPSFCRKYIKNIDYSLDIDQSQVVILGKILHDGIGECEFVNMINNGVDIYDNYINDDTLERKTKKKIFYTDIYSKYYTEGFKRFKNRFPKEGEYLEMLQKKKKLTYLGTNDNIDSTIPCLMQRFESDMFKDIMVNLNNKRIKYFPVHDAIYCSAEDKDEVYKTMNKIMNKHLGIISFNISPELL